MSSAFLLFVHPSNAIDHPFQRSSTTSTLIQTLDAKLVSLSEHNAAKAREETEHQEALNVVLKDVADRLREKQNASKRAAAAAGRKDGRDVDGMDVDEPGGSGAGNKGRKYMWSLFVGVCLPDADITLLGHHRRWSRRKPSAIGIDERLRCLLFSCLSPVVKHSCRYVSHQHCNLSFHHPRLLLWFRDA